MDITEGLTGEGLVTVEGRARTLQSRAKDKRLVENQGVRAGRKEVERFVGQLQEFGGNGRFNRRVRRTGPLVLGAALLGAALLLLTACGGDTGSANIGGSDSSLPASPTATASPTASPEASAEQKVLQDADAVDDLLNEFWTQELQAQYGPVFEPPDRYEYYRGDGNAPCGGRDRARPKNAYYCPVDTDEYVAFDLDWFASYLDDHPGGATTFLILAHEWGHAVQDTWVEQQPNTDVWNPPYRQELNADCLAGVWMADALRRGTVIEESGDAEAIFGWLWEAGSGPWFNPGDHGTPEQRQQAFSDGLTQGTHHCRRNY
jgi:predicted metalloprotease